MHSLFQRFLVALCFSTVMLSASAAAQSPLTLNRIAEGLFQFSNTAGNAGVVLITPQGAIVGDPLDITTAQSLLTLLDTEHQTQVKYVFYTHAAAERAAGAEIFANAGALIIAHENALQAATVIEEQVGSPDVVFSDSVSLRLGNQSVTLVHTGTNITDHMLVARFAWQQVVFAADFVAVESLPTVALDLGVFPDWFLSIDQLSKLDFVYLLDGQGNIGNRRDAKQHEYYLRELQAKVSRALDADQTPAQMLEQITMAKYQDWRNYSDALADNIESMQRALQSNR